VDNIAHYNLFSDPVCLFDLQVSPQFISEEDNKTESENEILCTPKPKRLRKSDGSGDLSLIVRNNITDASHDLIISIGNNIMYRFIVH
jgi:hypothetical protein